MNDNIYRYQRNSSIPNVVFALLILNGLVYALQWTFPREMDAFVLYSSNTGKFMPWQLLTYGFMHSTNGIYHILFNMLALWMFGREMEHVMGSKRFLIYWIVCVVGAGVVQILVSVVSGQPSATVGASGGVLGLLLAFAMTFPNRIIVLLIPPIPMKAKYFVVVFGLVTLYLGFSGGAPQVAHFAHLGGMLSGFMMLQYWARSRKT